MFSIADAICSAVGKRSLFLIPFAVTLRLKTAFWREQKTITFSMQMLSLSFDQKSNILNKVH